ncbi:MAG: ImmA/IrrE family metallo-endopeptidase [Oscillospiraceae bacterium]|jgi:hypothetical protein|nr:ImmA/IrrE family metallo-endopeptidase [Oscillospiraceae bacterium]
MPTPPLPFRACKNSIPVISKKTIDYLGEELVGDFCPKAMQTPMAIDIERFVQSYLGVEQDFQYLTNNGVYLGMTVFNDTSRLPVYNPETGQAEYISVRAGTVIIDKSLLKEGNENKYRFTMGHEGSHCILHSDYFAFNPDQTSLSGHSDVPLFRCKIADSGDEKRKPVSRWTYDDRMEWQANRLSSAILMPRLMVCRLVADSLPRTKEPFERGARDAFLDRMVLLIAGTFEVSRSAAAYRLRDLGLIDRKLNPDILSEMIRKRDVVSA